MPLEDGSEDDLIASNLNEQRNQTFLEEEDAPRLLFLSENELPLYYSLLPHVEDQVLKAGCFELVEQVCEHPAKGAVGLLEQEELGGTGEEGDHFCLLDTVSSLFLLPQLLKVDADLGLDLGLYALVLEEGGDGADAGSEGGDAVVNFEEEEEDGLQDVGEDDDVGDHGEGDIQGLEGVEGSDVAVGDGGEDRDREVEREEVLVVPGGLVQEGEGAGLQHPALGVGLVLHHVPADRVEEYADVVAEDDLEHHQPHQVVADSNLQPHLHPPEEVFVDQVHVVELEQHHQPQVVHFVDVQAPGQHEGHDGPQVDPEPRLEVPYRYLLATGLKVPQAVVGPVEVEQHVHEQQSQQHSRQNLLPEFAQLSGPGLDPVDKTDRGFGLQHEDRHELHQVPDEDPGLLRDNDLKLLCEAIGCASRVEASSHLVSGGKGSPVRKDPPDCFQNWRGSRPRLEQGLFDLLIGMHI